MSVVDGGVPMQIDGEPFNIEPVEGIGSEAFDVEIKLAGQALLLGTLRTVTYVTYRNLCYLRYLCCISRGRR